MERVRKHTGVAETARNEVQTRRTSNPSEGALARRIDNSALIVAQRRQLQSMFGDAIRPWGTEGERPAATVQREPDEEPLQGRFLAAQRAEEEEPLQGKFDTVQRAEEEEPLQGKLAAQGPAQLKSETASRPNNTGLPDNLKSGVESLSHIAMDNVRVHYNSSRPAQLNALAYAQGSDIHVAPGQEQHLPHEAWHVVQQAQGRVQPTIQLKDGILVNNDKGLEHEADVMGGRAASFGQGEGAGMKDGAGVVVPGNVIMRRVKAKIGGEEGESGNKADTTSRLGNTKRGRAVKACLESFAVQNDQQHAQYDCAEPHALSKFVDSKTTNENVKEKLESATVEDPMNYVGHNAPTYIHPCKICKQWAKGNKGAHYIGPGLCSNTMLNPAKY